MSPNSPDNNPPRKKTASHNMSPKKGHKLSAPKNYDQLNCPRNYLAEALNRRKAPLECVYSYRRSGFARRRHTAGLSRNKWASQRQRDASERPPEVFGCVIRIRRRYRPGPEYWPREKSRGTFDAEFRRR